VKKHVDSDSPGDPDGVDAYRHFFYNSAWPVMSEAEWLAMSEVLSVPKGGVEWRVLEERVSAGENTQPEYQYPPSWLSHFGVAGVWSGGGAGYCPQGEGGVRTLLRGRSSVAPGAVPG